MKSIWNIRPATYADIPEITRIYNYYALHTTITFDTKAQTEASKEKEMREIFQYAPYLIAEIDEKVIGYAYAKPWRSRPAYAQTYESTIYLAHDRNLDKTRGLGTALYQQLINELENSGHVHVLFGVTTESNLISDRLHEKLGFKKQAVFPEVGYKFGQWLAVHYHAYYFDNVK